MKLLNIITLAVTATLSLDAAFAECTKSQRKTIEANIPIKTEDDAFRVAMHAASRLGYGLDRGGNGWRLNLIRRQWQESAEATRDQIYTAICSAMSDGGKIPSRVRSVLETASPRTFISLGRSLGDMKILREKLESEKDEAKQIKIFDQIQKIRGELTESQWAFVLTNELLSGQTGFDIRTTEFWFNHFNVRDQLFGLDYLFKIHRCKNSTFHNLLRCTARHPAMLKYLDNRFNTKPGVRVFGQETGINENYAREIMELHTLGTGPGTIYRQTDVQEAAKILTGWSYRFVESGTEHTPQFMFYSTNHFPGVKTVMRTSYPSGEIGGEMFLKFLANHDRTKSFICRKLIRRFVGPVLRADSDRSILESCIDAWGQDGDLKAVYFAIISHPLMWSKETFLNDIKNPHEFVVTQWRLNGIQAIDLSLPKLASIRRQISHFGLSLTQVVPPTGYTEKNQRWLNAGLLIQYQKQAFRSAGPEALYYYVDSDGTHTYYGKEVEGLLRKLRHQSLTMEQMMEATVPRLTAMLFG